MGKSLKYMKVDTINLIYVLGVLHQRSYLIGILSVEPYAVLHIFVSRACWHQPIEAEGRLRRLTSVIVGRCLCAHGRCSCFRRWLISSDGPNLALEHVVNLYNSDQIWHLSNINMNESYSCAFLIEVSQIDSKQMYLYRCSTFWCQ